MPVQAYLQNLDPSRRELVESLLALFAANLPAGFEQAMSYNMPAFVVPLERYAPGYHCKKNEPLPFVSIASQKNHIAIYHMAFYDETLVEWFQSEWAKRISYKLDLGKCCLRFKPERELPLELLAELASKMTVDQWIARYEESLQKTKAGIKK